MGSFTFKWADPTNDPSDVLVTGSFDGWTKSVTLDKDADDGIFQKTVQFSEKDVANKIYYKFVVDHTWVINEDYPHEADYQGNINNFFTADDLVTSPPAPASDLAKDPFINTVTPESTTVEEMAKKNNNNKKNKMAAKEADVPAPATAPAVADSTPELGDASQGMATPSDVPGGFPATPLNETPNLENETVSVKPLPASAGIGNPIQLAPGEKIPDSITAQNTNEHVKLDKASYEKSDALPSALPLTTEIPSVSGTMIPESSLPMGGDFFEAANVAISSVGAGSTTATLAGQVPLEPKKDVAISSVGADSTTATLAGQVPLESKKDVTISSVGADSTTATLAGQVPLESKQATVPDVVKESQEKAGVSPEASAVPAEVKDKAKVEEEIKNTVPEVPAASVGTASGEAENKESTGAATIAAAAAIGSAAVAATVATAAKLSDDATSAAQTAKTTAAETVNNNLPDSIKDSLPVAAQNALASEKKESSVDDISSKVPEEVKESIAAAGESPEAAVSTSAVQDKEAVEAELLKEVKETSAVTEVAKSDAAEKKESSVAAGVPEEVKESIAAAGQSPEAAASTSAVQEKEAVEAELLKEVKEVPAVADVTESSAAAEAKAVEAAEPVEEKPAEKAVEATPAVIEPVAEKAVEPTPVVVEPVAEKAVDTTPVVAEPVAVEPAVADTPSTDAPAATTTTAAADDHVPETSTTEPQTADGATEHTPVDSTSEKKKNRLSIMFDKLKAKLK
ncbi:hypothetical protein E4U49_006575 [Claviceps purpurea]|nr:hypothetical protein E4U49_006575 [Claviceps purpurea]